MLNAPSNSNEHFIEDVDSDELFTVLNCPTSTIVESPASNHPAQSRHILIIREGDHEQLVTLNDTTYSIGRHHANSIVIENSVVSRQHAILLRIASQKKRSIFFPNY